MKVLQFSQAKTGLSEVFDEVVRSGARVVERRKTPRVAFVRSDEISALLAEHFPFTTEVSRGDDGTISVWLRELALFGRGPRLSDAVEDLLDEIEDYVAEWEASLGQAPNHAQRRWWVHRVQLAGDRDEVRDIVFAPSVP